MKIDKKWIIIISIILGFIVFISYYTGYYDGIINSYDIISKDFNTNYVCIKRINTTIGYLGSFNFTLKK